MRLDWIGGWDQRSRQSGNVRERGDAGSSGAQEFPNRFHRGAKISLQHKFIVATGVTFIGLLVTAFAIQSLYASQPEVPQKSAVIIEKTPTIEMVEVLVPVRTIEAGKALDPTMFMKVKRPAHAVTEGSLRSPEQVRGLYARTAIPSGQIFHKEYTTTVRPSNPIAQNIPDRFRAVTINVNATSGVEGWARAGARVDVSWITDLDGQRTATVIVQNAKVLSAERQVDPAGDQKKDAPIPTTVTLLASERDAKRISLAATDGQLVLLLRGADDSGKSSAATGSMRFDDLLGAKAAPSSNSRVQGFVKIGGKGRVGTEEFVLFDNGQLLKKGAAE